MARARGTRNADYDKVRSQLLVDIRAHLLLNSANKISFREMAEHAGVSVPTLRHYFGTRTNLMQQIFADLRRQGSRYVDDAKRSDLDFEASMQALAQAILAGARLGRMDRVHRLGLTEGLGDAELGPSYLNCILEPSLQAIEMRLDVHGERGEFQAASTRHAALAFAAPLILAVLHQAELGGDCVRPLDLAEFAKNHAAAFALAHGVAKKTKRGGKDG